MKNSQTACAMLADASIILQEAEASQAAGHYHRTVRKSQEAAELAVKGLFRFLGVEYPKVHTLGGVILRELKQRAALRSHDLERLATWMDVLSAERERAFYGSAEGIPPAQLFDGEDGKDALEKARWIVDCVRQVLR